MFGLMLFVLVCIEVAIGASLEGVTIYGRRITREVDIATEAQAMYDYFLLTEISLEMQATIQWEELAAMPTFEALTDVRCFATGDLRNTTSQSGVEQRALAANELYRHLRTASNVIGGIMGTSPLARIKNLGVMTVTYADNWKEDWIPTTATFSEAFNFDPAPNSLRGNPAEAGTIQPGTSCVKS